jgi:hypothetical protein
MLRVKQAANPLFNFLSPADPLHPYYRWLLGAGAALLDRADDAAAAAAAAAAHSPAAEFGPALPSPGSRGGSPGSGAEARGAGEGGAQHALALLAAYDEDAEVEQQEGQEAGAEEAGAAAGPDPGAARQAAPQSPAAGAGAPVQQAEQQAEQWAQQQQQLEALQAPREEEPGVPGIDDVPGGREPPPAATRTIVNKLVAFVGRNGAKFEAVVRRREAANPLFGFLLPWHQHHWYYR